MVISDLIKVRMKSLITDLSSIHHLNSVSLFIRTKNGIERYVTCPVGQSDILNRTSDSAEFTARLSEVMDKGGILLAVSGSPNGIRKKTTGYILCNGDWTSCSREIIDLLIDVI